MRKRPRSTGKPSRRLRRDGGAAFLYPMAGVAALLALWQAVCWLGLLPPYALPSPAAVCRAFVGAFPLLMSHAAVSVAEAFIGLTAGVALAFLAAVVMDAWPAAHKTLYPLLVISQTVPPVAVAPLLVLWFGYGMTPKVLLIVIVCFFPVAVALLDAFRGLDQDVYRLLRAMGASRWQVFIHAKLPGALPAFFSGLKIAVSYAVVGAVVAEWLGGERGLGVYMTRVRKSYAFDKMFAVIFLISAVSILLIRLVALLERAAMPWKKYEEEGNATL